MNFISNRILNISKPSMTITQFIRLTLIILASLHIINLAYNIDPHEMIEFEVYPDTNTMNLVSLACEGKYQSCSRLSIPAIDFYKLENFQIPLYNYRYNEICKCLLPPQSKVKQLQLLHIPKTGTSINWLLHSYFDDCYINISNPCSNFLRNASELYQGLCNGRLFSCAGHRVASNLPELSFRDSTNMITILREPFNRLQSDYYYLKSKPESMHLGEEINTTHLLSTVKSLNDYTMYPGISNCATKMLNGIQCGDNIQLNDSHIETAKKVLMAFLWFGITEYFNTSVCQFSFLYGGDPIPLHFTKSRVGNYEYKSKHEVFSSREVEIFNEIHRFDIEVYNFAVHVFLNRVKVTKCPVID